MEKNEFFENVETQSVLDKYSQNDFNDENVSLDNSKKILEEIKKFDKNYEKYKLFYNKRWKNGKFYKRIIVECYGSGDNGTYIRNAQTGEVTSFKVGSKYEHLFYSVLISTGYNKRRDPLLLFYDSPEQYENHWYKILDKDTKDKWFQKYKNMRLILDKEYNSNVKKLEQRI